MERILIGLDLGTQGARAMAATETGTVLAAAARSYPANEAEEPFREQDALRWRAAAFDALREIAPAVRAAKGPAVLACDGTSGTFLPVDDRGAPLRRAILYNDGRARAQLPRVRACAAALEEKQGCTVGAAFALPKLCWLREHEPEVFEKAARFVHQADYLAGCLTGDFSKTDYSSALKTGCDLTAAAWPADVMAALGIDVRKLPEILAPGTPMGRLSAAAAAETGLPADTVVAAGATDGYASCIAAGVVAPGQWNSTIGTTLVLKGVTKQLIRDPQGRVYCHRHPEGWWYPGGAGNVGGLLLNERFGAENFGRLDRAVPGVVPTGSVVYPLPGRGERFPFARPDAEGFSILRRDDEAGRYAAVLEGVGYVERLCFETLEGLGCAVGPEISIAGGAARAPVWSQVRADILGRQLRETACVEAAFGSAILAGTGALGRTLTQSASAMVRTARVFAPDLEKHRQYDEIYAEFLAECAKRGYLT